MRERVIEKTAAVACALFLTVGVLGGVVYARGSDAGKNSAPETETVIPEDVTAEESEALTSGEAGVGELSAWEPTPTPGEVTDNRDVIPLRVNGMDAATCVITGGVPCMTAGDFCRALGMDVSESFTDGVMQVSCDSLSFQVMPDSMYFTCNDRYLMAQEGGVREQNGQLLLPVEALAMCLGVPASWDRVGWSVDITADVIRPLEDGDSFYDPTDLYWLSRVIYAEAGTQSLLGQVAVGSVVLNRLADQGEFGSQSTIYDVIFAKNQFEVVTNGMIYMEPDDTATVAAKLALEGYDVVDGAMYFATFDFGEGYQCVMWIEDHCFMNEA